MKPYPSCRGLPPPPQKPQITLTTPFWIIRYLTENGDVLHVEAYQTSKEADAKFLDRIEKRYETHAKRLELQRVDPNNVNCIVPEQAYTFGKDMRRITKNY